MQIQVKYPTDPVGSHKVNIKSHPGRDRGEGHWGVAVDGLGVQVHDGVHLDRAPDYEHLAHRTWQVVPTY